MSEDEHIPVLLDEVIELLDINEDGVYIDATIGRGGHASRILEILQEDEGLLLGIDKDREALEYCREHLDYDNLKLFQCSFIEIPQILAAENIEAVDGVLFDLGVSSPQLDSPERGFSYSKDAPLDMRMNQNQSLSAADIVNERSRDELAGIIKKYGEERWADRIAEFIVSRREKNPIKTTGDLVSIIKDAIPASARRSGGHPARRTFQALRIATNRELEELETALQFLPEILKVGGRVCFISFHSLEDRMIKHKFKDFARKCECPPDLPVCRCDKIKEFEILTSSPVQAEEKERSNNPRARSAKLRSAEKL